MADTGFFNPIDLFPMGRLISHAIGISRTQFEQELPAPSGWLVSLKPVYGSQILSRDMIRVEHLYLRWLYCRKVMRLRDVAEIYLNDLVHCTIESSMEYGLEE